tara:strand:- start:48 stop:521 length:474 start_codon:yes stop_codon:yes gene_type:complete
MFNKDFYQITKDILYHPEFLKLKSLRHHKKDIYHHVVRVSYLSYVIAKRLKLDSVAAARGGLLHDFFVYDWRHEGSIKKKKLFEKHGFTHAKEALDNAQTHFNLTPKEKDIIIKHMFPLNPTPPKYAESWLVTLVDKYVTTQEYLESVRIVLFKESR